MRREVLLGIIAISIFLGMSLVAFPDGAAALLVVLVLSLGFLGIFRHYADDKEFVTNIFIAGLILRLAFGIAVHVFDLRGFFGGDALTYDFRGDLLMHSWIGGGQILDPDTQQTLSSSSPGWGMNYLVGFIYLILGRNIFAAQSFCGVIGAATAPMVYFCAWKIFGNRPVARTAALVVALFPSFVIWSGQLLKDGLIIFLLVLAITMLLRLQEKLDFLALALLFLSLGGILTLRFYIFYMVGVAVAGSFVVGVSSSGGSLIRRTAALVILGLGVTYFGITRYAAQDVNNYGNLQKLQNSRLDLAQSGKSGFAEDVDVSTTQGAISAIPVGFTYLMFAPFPWEASSVRQLITLPEVFLWWAMMPLLVYGLWWAIRHKLRSSLPVLIFSLMLTLAYSIFQGNVGTAYRQRTQIQVFLFIFISVGWQLYRERVEDRKLLRLSRQRQLEHALKARAQQS
jgi:4-amino-4-deoxy-L-arabinose transferase-like glycosyltransferase